MPSTPKLVQILALGAAAVAALFLALAIAPGAVGYRSTIVTDDGAGVPGGSVAISEVVPVDEIAPGDKVTYRLPGAAELDLGRVKEVDAAQGRLAIAGSGAESGTLLASGWTFPRVRWVIPLAGHVAGVARSPVGLGVIVVLLLVGLIAERSDSHQELVAETGEGPARLEPGLGADPLPAAASGSPAEPARPALPARRVPPPPPPPPPQPDAGAAPGSASRPPGAPTAPDGATGSRPALRSVGRPPESDPTVRDLFARRAPRRAPGAEERGAGEVDTPNAADDAPADAPAAPPRAVPED